MKRIQIVACSALAVALMGSCSKDQVTHENPGNAIRFNALTGVATKADYTTDNLAAFNVFGRAASTTSLNFDDSYVKSDVDGSWSFGSTDYHYWPSTLTENMTFYAYAPQTLTDYGVSAITESGSTIKLSNVTVPVHTQQHVDLIFARTQTNRGTTTGAVTLNFEHAFSQVELWASCGDPNIKVTVYGAKIFGPKPTSTLTFPSSDTKLYQTTDQNTDNITSGVWDAMSGNNSSYMAGGSERAGVEVNSTDAVNIMNGDGNFMFIPHNPGAAWDPTNDANNNSNGGYIAVLCKIEKLNAQGTYDQIFPTPNATDPLLTKKCAFTAVPFSNNYQKGRKFTVTLKFFTDGGGGGIIPPDPTDPSKPDPDPDIDEGGNPGDPVLAPITFEVQVSDWNQQTGNATLQ